MPLDQIKGTGRGYYEARSHQPVNVKVNIDNTGKAMRVVLCELTGYNYILGNWIL